MSILYFMLPGDLSIRTGGYSYDAHIIEGLRQMGWSVLLHTLSERFPSPTVEDFRQAEAIFASLPSAATVIIDSLALGAMPEQIKRHSKRLRLIALIHHPLALETGLTLSERERLLMSEREALRWVRGVIATSNSTAKALAAYDVAASRIGVVTPGTDPAPLAIGSGAEQLNLLCVATLIPRKGHAVLFQALSGLRDKPWRLTCIGSDSHSPETAAALRQLLKELGLQDRIALIGERDPSALAPYYHSADLFVLSSYHEGFGMVLAEAMAHGLPIISTTAGAIPETVGDAALLVPPGDSRALAGALSQLIDDPALRQRLAAAARRHVLPDWPTACARFAAELQQVDDG